MYTDSLWYAIWLLYYLSVVKPSHIGLYTPLTSALTAILNISKVTAAVRNHTLSADVRVAAELVQIKNTSVRVGLELSAQNTLTDIIIIGDI